MDDPYFMLLQIYRERNSIEWDILVRLSKDVEYVGNFDDEHGLKLEIANNYLKKYEFIKQVYDKPEHYITEKGKNFYGIEFLKREKIRIREEKQDELTQSLINTNNAITRNVKSQKIFNIITISVGALTLLTLVIYTYYTSKSISEASFLRLDSTLQNNTKKLDSMLQVQKGIGTSLRTIAEKDSTKH